MKYGNIFLTIIFVAFVAGFVFQDSYVFVQPVDWWQLLTSDYAPTGESQFLTVYGIFTTIHVTFAGIIIAITSIVLSRNKFSLSGYYNYIAPEDWVKLAMLLYIAAITTVILTSYVRYTLLVDLWLKVSLLFPVYALLLLTSNLTKSESQEFLKDLMLKSLKQSDHPEVYFREVFLSSFRENLFEQLSSIIIDASNSTDLSREELYDKVVRINKEIERAAL